MKGKSILLSALALVLYIGFIVGMVFLFKIHFMLGIAGILLLFVPLKIQQKAAACAENKIEEIFSKYIISALLLIGIVFVVLYFTLWMK